MPVEAVWQVRVKLLPSSTVPEALLLIVGAWGTTAQNKSKAASQPHSLFPAINVHVPLSNDFSFQILVSIQPFRYYAKPAGFLQMSTAQQLCRIIVQAFQKTKANQMQKPNKQSQNNSKQVELSLTFILLDSRIPYANDSASSKGFHVHKSPSRGRSCSVFEIFHITISVYPHSTHSFNQPFLLT